MEEMITVGKAAESLGVTGQTIRRLIHAQKLKAILTEGGKFRIFRSSLDEYIQSRLVSTLEKQD